MEAFHPWTHWSSRVLWPTSALTLHNFIILLIFFIKVDWVKMFVMFYLLWHCRGKVLFLKPFHVSLTFLTVCKHNTMHILNKMSTTIFKYVFIKSWICKIEQKARMTCHQKSWGRNKPACSMSAKTGSPSCQAPTTLPNTPNTNS